MALPSGFGAGGAGFLTCGRLGAVSATGRASRPRLVPRAHRAPSSPIASFVLVVNTVVVTPSARERARAERPVTGIPAPSRDAAAAVRASRGAIAARPAPEA